MHTLIERAARFAAEAHAGQRRKYTGEPYAEHPFRVAQMVAAVTADPCVVAAALLHDTVEDTPVSDSDIRRLFGDRVADLVAEVTDVSRPEDGNRKTRKALDRDHLARASAEGQTIKLADLIDNSDSILAHDPKFAAVYLREKKELLEVLTQGDAGLYRQARRIVETFEEVES